MPLVGGTRWKIKTDTIKVAWKWGKNKLFRIIEGTIIIFDEENVIRRKTVKFRLNFKAWKIPGFSRERNPDSIINEMFSLFPSRIVFQIRGIRTNKEKRHSGTRILL